MRTLRIKQIVLAAVTIFFAAQFIPVTTRNLAVEAGQTIYAKETVPAPVRSIFENSCQDCHSNQTRWPWYSHLAPMSWLVAHDVAEGRRHLNLSEWAKYSDKDREDKLELICEQVTNGDMPDGKYAFFHRQRRLSEQQRDAVCEWVEQVR